MLFEWDQQLFYFINKGLSCGVLNGFMPLLNALGTSEFVIILILVLLPQNRTTRLTALMLALGLVLKEYSGDALKAVFGRPRPFEVLSGINHLMQASGSAFPSGHTTTAFLTQTMLWHIVKTFKNRAILVILAGAVGFARIYVGVHWPSDVAAGILLGTTIGCLLSAILRWGERRITGGTR